MCMVLDIMAGALSGGGCSREPSPGGWNTLLVGAIDITAFRPIEEFKKEVGDFVQYVKASPRQPGVEEILVPGEPEFREREKRQREGIPIDEGTWSKIAACAREVGVEVEG